MMNSAQELAEEYLRLGGKRLLVMDDNILSTNSWEADPSKRKPSGKGKSRVCRLSGEAKSCHSCLPSTSLETTGRWTSATSRMNAIRCKRNR